MKKIVCLTSSKSVGCTFVDWSIYFLSGQTRFFNARDHQWQALINNPIIKNAGVGNAHMHDKNHPSGQQRTQSYIDAIAQQPDGLYSVYPSPPYFELVCEQLGIDYQQLSNANLLDQVVTHQYREYFATLDSCIEQDLKLIFIHSDPRAVGYFWEVRSLDRTVFTNQAVTSPEEIIHEVNQVFFNDVVHDTVWDQRERMSLNLRPFDLKFHQFDYGTSHKHLWLNCLELWQSPITTLMRIMQYLELDIDPQRLVSWEPIAHMWQEIQSRNLRFFHQLDHIVQAIVKGWHFPLSELTLKQEAIIQHCLIYSHNLNIKTWNLEKFPSNTIELHKLLEPNFHTIKNIYNF
jgi:hypothetical protein